jgi:hypothetical protein
MRLRQDRRGKASAQPSSFPATSPCPVPTSHSPIPPTHHLLHTPPPSIADIGLTASSTAPIVVVYLIASTLNPLCDIPTASSPDWVPTATPRAPFYGRWGDDVPVTPILIWGTLPPFLHLRVANSDLVIVSHRPTHQRIA